MGGFRNLGNRGVKSERGVVSVKYGNSEVFSQTDFVNNKVADTMSGKSVYITV